MKMEELARLVKESSLKLAAVGGELKNKALLNIAASLKEEEQEIIKANRIDLERSEKEDLPEPLMKRLVFDEAKNADIIAGITELVKLQDPVGKTLLSTELDDGLDLYKVTSPIGVIGVIFESRPDALVQIATLCLKSGNGVLLKGGSEALETNRILARIIIKAAENAGIPPHWAALLETREDANKMLVLDEYIDLLIPRGSNYFVRYIMDNSSIPVLGHADGVCHCYVHEDADLDMALKIVVDSKTQYVAVCNAAETLLVHEDVAAAFLPRLKEALESHHVEIFGCSRTCALIEAEPATDNTWQIEYLDYKLSVKIVSGVGEAVNHINQYGSGHTDAIITENSGTAAYFMDYVDSGNVFWNCSTRFSDGFRYGFGAEVGISTAKIHSRGPVGLDGLVIYKYKLLGRGHIVADYASHSKTFKHRDLKKDYPLG